MASRGASRAVRGVPQAPVVHPAGRGRPCPLTSVYTAESSIPKSPVSHSLVCRVVWGREMNVVLHHFHNVPFRNFFFNAFFFF